jgi:hypothetical protein
MAHAPSAKDHQASDSADNKACHNGERIALWAMSTYDCELSPTFFVSSGHYGYSHAGRCGL